MPYIETKTTVSVSPEKKEAVKAALGQAVSLLGKSESFLMVGIQDGFDLYMAGNRLDKGAYVSVSLFGNASSSAYEKMTEQICGILERELDIPGKNVYVTYHGIRDWGWNGGNF